MKRQIDLWEHSGHILRQVQKGALLTTAAEGRVNTMTIGWGSLGFQWRKPIFIVYVRKSRYTHELLEKNPQFTVNILLEECDPAILRLCGTCSGRDTDKLAQLQLTPVEGQSVAVPAIAQLPLTLECQVIYSQSQEPEAIDKEVRAHYYGDEDYHTAYYGQITAAYVIE